jgi:hypothetical protein
MIFGINKNKIQYNITLTSKTGHSPTNALPRLISSAFVGE